MFSHQQRYGLQGERWAKKELEKRGYQATLMRDFEHPFDILVNGVLAVEVKIARPTLRLVRPGYYKPRYQFDLTRGLRKSERDWLLIAICDDNETFYPFLLPSHWLNSRRTLQITSQPTQYNGYASAGLENWGMVSTVLKLAQNPLQPPLFI